MSLLRRNKPRPECTLINTKEDGTKLFVCRVDEGKVFQVEVDKTGKVNVDPKFVFATPEDYKRIHDAISESSTPV